MSPPKRPVLDRFWEKVKKGPGCWEWQGGTFINGYGMFNVLREQPRGAHRVAFEIQHGAIEAGVPVCHRCDNPRCVRGDHIFAGTPAVNHHDAMRKGRHTHGVRQHLAKLNPDKVRQIRRRQRNESCAAIAADLGVNPSTVERVIRGETWKQVS